MLYFVNKLPHKYVLEQPEVKIATRNMFYDEYGKHRRTREEIMDEHGNIRPGCSVIPKGEVYESHIFMKKEKWFKDKAFTGEVKEMYTKLINNYVKEEAEKLSVFQQGGVYLATRKIGRNNPRAAEIRADNAARQDWNRTVDVALVEGVPEEDILKVKQEKINERRWNPYGSMAESLICSVRLLEAQKIFCRR